ncbi:unnamed protein product [Rangifer tarandus platyrhynchus]|uniref:Uncharacterized protein n=1 Tax=Rangifer tarandus platyrhynchus TaxID=3082113 RepID=A0ABN8ZA16_RANTA|nr:unnamed protein product [Rangifer tarandus platyrhynchus]
MWLFCAENRTVYLRNSVLDGGSGSNLKPSQQQSGALWGFGSDSPDSSATPPQLRAGSHLPCPRRGSEALRAEGGGLPLRELLAAGAEGKHLSPAGPGGQSHRSSARAVRTHCLCGNRCLGFR